MTVQREDTEPEEYRGSRGPSDYRTDPNFKWPTRMPWSQLGPQFIKLWGLADPKDPQPEHVEIVGQNGSGKSYLECTLLQDRLRARRRSAVLVCTKKADRVFGKLGWPIVSSLDEARDRKYANFIFWPQTKLMGSERKAFYDAKIQSLLHELWQKDANITVAFDEIGFVQDLSGEMKSLIQQYWREARSLGIDIVGMKQRPQGALRDMHSETYWTAAFKPKDRSDLERWAELFGARRDWMPVFDSLHRGAPRREFIIANPLYDEAHISWIDVPLTPVKAKHERPRWLFGGDGSDREA